MGARQVRIRFSDTEGLLPVLCLVSAAPWDVRLQL
jgi:hypothetical protein